jgi:hypothetical protein
VCSESQRGGSISACSILRKLPAHARCRV